MSLLIVDENYLWVYLYTTTYETESNVFCVILRSVARFSFTRTLPHRYADFVAKRSASFARSGAMPHEALHLSSCAERHGEYGVRREETVRKKTTHENLIHISLNSTKIHMSGMEFLIVQSVFDETF